LTRAIPHSFREAIEALDFLEDRTPESTGMDDASCALADYRDGGVFLAWFAGRSEWERHGNGDELVLVLEGATTLVLLADGGEVEHDLCGGELFVVPQGTWHRFDSAHGVKVLTITPQPTDHSVRAPS
jgi:mannose-6-phosphate isomerase-like protein (cupin superfamily)